MRYVITRVLPEPAPASTSSGPPPWLAASRCGGLSLPRSTTERRTLRISTRDRQRSSYAPRRGSLRRARRRAARTRSRGFRIVRKDRSRLHRAIHHALVVVTFGRMRDYLDSYQTTIGRTVYVTRRLGRLRPDRALRDAAPRGGPPAPVSPLDAAGDGGALPARAAADGARVLSRALREGGLRGDDPRRRRGVGLATCRGAPTIAST